MLQLTAGQLTIAALVASAIVFFLKLYAKTNKKWNPKAGTLSILVYIASYVVAFYFGGYVFPAFPAFVDLGTFVPLLLTWSVDVIAVLSIVAGVAMLVYNVIWKKVLEWFVARPAAISAYFAKRKK